MFQEVYIQKSVIFFHLIYQNRKNISFIHRFCLYCLRSNFDALWPQVFIFQKSGWKDRLKMLSVKTEQKLYEEIFSSFTVIDFIINARSNHITRLHLGESCINIALFCCYCHYIFSNIKTWDACCSIAIKTINAQSQLRNFGIGLDLFASWHMGMQISQPINQHCCLNFWELSCHWFLYTVYGWDQGALYQLWEAYKALLPQSRICEYLQISLTHEQSKC